MIERRTIVERVLIYADGTISVRLGKQLVDGDTVLSSSPHLVGLNPGDDVDKVMAANNAHLAAMGCAECADYRLIKTHAALAHTADAIANYRAKQEESA